LVAERLLQYIAEENLRQGDRLPTEQGLAEILGTTRNVVREAVKVLAAMGRLSVQAGRRDLRRLGRRGAREDELAHFQPTDMEHVLMLLDYRRLIESENARRAASIANPVEVRAIRQSAEDSAVDGVREDPETFTQRTRSSTGR